MENKFYNQALRFLSYRTRSEKEVREYLKRKIKSDKDKASRTIESIIDKLKKYNFINDEEFARKWVENRNKFKPRSMRLIKLELKKKGISQEIVGNLESVNDNDKDLEQAKKLVEKKIAKYEKLGRQEVYEKLGRHLASKGFGWNIIKKSIDEALSKGV